MDSQEAPCPAGVACRWKLTTRAYRVTWGLIVAVALVNAAPAQPPADPPAERTDESSQRDEAEQQESPKPNERIGFQEKVVVIAQKRNEDLRTVPISLAVFTSSQIEEAGIEKPADFVALVPNLFIADTLTVGSSLVMCRGVSQTHNGSSPLAVVVDGVYQGNEKQLNQELFDIERIEVLKGPEGALYGRNSIGGALNILTQQPTETFEGHARTSAGNGTSLGTTAAVSGPLHADDLLYRFSGSYKTSDGLIENTFLNTPVDMYDDRTGRLQLRWRAAPRLSLDWRAAISDTKGGAVQYAIFPTTGSTNDFSFEPESNILGSSKRKMTDYSMRAEWSGDALTFTSITGYSTVSEFYRGDADFSHPGGSIATPFGQLGQGQDLTARMLSQELRVASPEQPVRWISGVYLIKTDRQLESQLFADTDGTIGGFVPIVRLAEDGDNTAWAVFAQLDVDLSDRWTLSASARYDRDERKQEDLVAGVSRKAVFDAWQPRLTVSYQASDKFMAYLNSGWGFRSGGYNAPTVTPDIFKDELSKNIELGVRSTLADQRLRIDGAGYFTRLDDAQYFRLDFASASQVIDNMNDVEIRGVELTVTGVPVQGLEVYAAVGYNDSEIEEFDGTGRFAGNQTPTNIRSTLNLGIQYARLLGKGTVGIFRADLERRGKQYWTPDNIDVQDPISLLNLRMSFLTGRWTVTARVKNVTDEKYYVEYGDAMWAGVASGDDIGWLGRPRSYGVDLTRKF